MALYWHNFWEGTEKIAGNDRLQKLKGSELENTAHIKNENSYIWFMEKDGWSVSIQSVLANCGIVNISVESPVSLEKTLSICKAMGYSVVIYTTAHHQKYHIDELKRLGFTSSKAVKNTRSDNKIQVWTKDITDFTGEFQ
jgi:hypothetical protein